MEDVNEINKKIKDHVKGLKQFLKQNPKSEYWII